MGKKIGWIIIGFFIGMVITYVIIVLLESSCSSQIRTITIKGNVQNNAHVRGGPAGDAGELYPDPGWSMMDNNGTPNLSVTVNLPAGYSLIPLPDSNPVDGVNCRYYHIYATDTSPQYPPNNQIVLSNIPAGKMLIITLYQVQVDSSGVKKVVAEKGVHVLSQGVGSNKGKLLKFLGL